MTHRELFKRWDRREALHGRERSREPLDLGPASGAVYTITLTRDFSGQSRGRLTTPKKRCRPQISAGETITGFPEEPFLTSD